MISAPEFRGRIEAFDAGYRRDLRRSLLGFLTSIGVLILVGWIWRSTPGWIALLWILVTVTLVYQVPVRRSHARITSLGLLCESCGKPLVSSKLTAFEQRSGICPACGVPAIEEPAEARLPFRYEVINAFAIAIQGRIVTGDIRAGKIRVGAKLMLEGQPGAGVWTLTGLGFVTKFSDPPHSHVSLSFLDAPPLEEWRTLMVPGSVLVEAERSPS
jgi:predicted RNA-binding Zn-ribbon protein involved in translation (DUF1610 family)